MAAYLIFSRPKKVTRTTAKNSQKSHSGHRRGFPSNKVDSCVNEEGKNWVKWKPYPQKYISDPPYLFKKENKELESL